MTHYFFLVIIALFVTFSHLSTLNFFNIQTQSIQQADCLPYYCYASTDIKNLLRFFLQLHFSTFHSQLSFILHGIHLDHLPNDVI